MTSQAELFALAREGEALRDRGDLLGADAHMAVVVARFPDFLHGAILWADIAMRAGQWPEAARRWKAIRSRFPDQEVAWIEYPAALRQSGDLPAARAALVEAHGRFPDTGRPLHDLARLAHERRDWEEAAGWWRRFRDILPNVWFGYTEAAGALRELGQIEQAEELLHVGYRVLSDAGVSGHDLAKVAEARGDWAAVARHWADHCAQHPDDWNGYANQAHALRQSRQLVSAIAVLRDASERLQDDPRPLRDMARLAEELSEWDTAADAWSRFGKKFPDTWLGFTGHAGALRRLGRTEEAETLLRGTIERFPGEDGPIHMLVDLLKLAGRVPEAIDAVNWGLNHNPDHTGFLTLRTDLLLKLDRRDDVFANWQDLPEDTLDSIHRKRLAACEILRRNGATAFEPDLVHFLVAEPDTGDVMWLPCYSEYLYNLRSGANPPIPQMIAFYNSRPALFAGTLHRLIWIAALGLPSDDSDFDDVMTQVVMPGRFGIASLLFSFYVLSDRPAWREAVQARLIPRLRPSVWCGDGPWSDSACLGTVLILAITYMYWKEVFWECAGDLRGIPGDANPALPGEMASSCQILSRFLADTSKAGRFSAVPPKIVRATDRRLRIAICVSGQLRGFREAYPTWHCTGLFQHDIRIFVHTWREMGKHWRRTWDFFQFSHPSIWDILRHAGGPAILAAHFPALAKAAEGDRAAVAHADIPMLRNFYATEYVGLEDDMLPPFNNRPNDWKMLYKIQKAHELALSSGESFDLFVRIRPDVALNFADAWDFNRMAYESELDRKLFVDIPNRFTGPDGKLRAGDQIAIGTGEPMAVYANTVAWDPAGASLIGAPPSHKAHETLGSALFAQGVMTEELKGVQSSILLNPPTLSPQSVAFLAEIDAPRAPDSDFARGFLDACRRVGGRPD